jgi:hypothetical protein
VEGYQQNKTTNIANITNKKTRQHMARTDLQKAMTFAEQQCTVFQNNPSQLPAAEEEINKQLETPFQMALPINK